MNCPVAPKIDWLESFRRPSANVRAIPAMGKTFVPKKGKQRMYSKTLIPQKQTRLWKATPYVRGGVKTSKSRGDRERWCYSVKEIYKATELKLIRDLQKQGHLDEKKGKTCPVCKKGILGPLTFYPLRKSYAYRCTKNHKCNNYVLPHHEHPIFSTGGGRHCSSLDDQVAILFCAVSGTTEVNTHRITDKNHKMVEGISKRLDQCRQIVVERDEKSIQFGNTCGWADVEGDEVDLGKKEVGANEGDAADEVVQWEQWQGLVERGDRKTLVLSKTRPKKMVRRAPGPGPLKKVDWAPIANRYLKGKRVIFHSDGAKSYRLKTTPVDGIAHDWVVHKKKKVTIKGKTFWMKPKYVSLVEHRMADGTVVRAKGGTQIIDRTWSFLRKHIGNRSAHIGKASMKARVRSAQWCYWHQGDDLWAQTGLMLKSLFV